MQYESVKINMKYYTCKKKKNIITYIVNIIYLSEVNILARCK